MEEVKTVVDLNQTKAACISAPFFSFRCAPSPAFVCKTQVVKIDLNQPMDKIREILGGYSIRTRLSLTGTMVVARDIAHAKLQERIDAGQGLPDYVKDHIIYYAGERARDNTTREQRNAACTGA